MSKFNHDKLKKLRLVNNIFKIFYRKRKGDFSLPIEKNELKTIVIMGMMMIGDTIMLIPALRVLKRNYPNAYIIALCGPVVKTILEDQYMVDEFVVAKSPWLFNDYSFNTLFNLLSSIRKLKKRKADLSIDFRGDWRNIFLMNFINAKRSVSFNYSGGEYMLTDIIPQNPKIAHYIDEWLYLLEKIGCETTDADKYPLLKLNKEDAGYLAHFSNSNKLENRLVIGLHAGASSISRRWPAVKYADVLVRISKKIKNCTFILFEGPNEGDVTNELTNILNDSEVKYIVVNVSLKRYLAIMNSCNLLICNDSGAGHIAGAFSIPSVIIYGKADVDTVKPYSKALVKTISHRKSGREELDVIDVKENQDYLASITISEVYEAVLLAINNLELQKSF